MSHTTLVDVATLAAHLNAPDWVVIDCRFELGKPDAGESAYAAGHVPGARYGHLDRDFAGPVGPTTGRHPLPDPAVFAAKAAAWGINAATQVVVLDQGNSFFAARAWWVFRWLGHARVAVLDGGLAAWQAAGLALTAAAPQPAAGGFRAVADASQVVDAADVLRSLATDERRLVDARGADRYAGENETIDAVGGHVPGAVNHHYARNYLPDGRMKDAATLRAEWLATLGGREPRAMIAMCGSGVSACVNLLALEHAGLSGARLYPGSWSEWIRDPSRPMARGPR
jgi:thiosulfate/3-mercaptopyruvate sulfurtransferase